MSCGTGTRDRGRGRGRARRITSTCLQHRADHAPDPRAQGYVTHELSGRAHVYVPVVDRVAARQRAVSHLLSRFFDGSPELLVLNLLGRDAPDEEDLRACVT